LLQEIPLTFGCLTHLSKLSSHIPTLHWSDEEVQITPAPFTQTPLTHASAPLQYNPSLQDKPLAFGSLMHRPVFVLHTPSLHASVNPVQLADTVHCFFWHTPAPSQYPSVHGVPVGFGWYAHLSEFSSHMPVWHWPLKLLQSIAYPLAQTPLWQVSAPSQ